MAYSVKQVADMAGVSVRTLHFYDETGLLNPAYVGANGYRYYEEAQLLMLQQILFYRELGLELKQIRKFLNRPNFDKIAALESHWRTLQKRLTHTQELLRTIDKTIAHLKGTKKMKSAGLFAGFDPKQQAQHERYLIDRYGEIMRESIAQSKARVKDWSKRDWQEAGAEFSTICEDLVHALTQEFSAGSREAQAVIARHFQWLARFWQPDRESYAGHSQLIVDSDLRKAYEAHDRRLPEFAAAAMRIFAERELV
jgi:DNA-binding transcriptional MerR regulator